jgi:DNA ligase (NAD+)
MKSIGKINNYINQVGIKGIDISTLEKMHSAGLLENITSLYTLDYIKLSRIPGLGDKSATNIMDSIFAVTPNDYDILAGLGISNFGKDTAKRLLTETSFDNLCNKDYVNGDEFKTVLNNTSGIGSKMSSIITKGLNECNELLNEILLHVKFKSVKRVKLDNQFIFVATGDPDPKYFANRAELKEYIESKGHKMTGSVSKKTNYLITENPNSGTVKNKKAQELGVKIITCAELKDILN